MIVEKTEKYYEKLERIQNLPSIPVVMIEVSRMLDNPRTSAAELGRVISKDQGLVTKILRIANSPLFGLPRKVSTIEFAIVILGFNHIRNIIIALSALEAFNGKNDKYWDRKQFWSHSVLTASVAKCIAEEIGFRKSGEAFIAGLLHDLGISVIQRHFHEEFLIICEMNEDDGIPFTEAESKIMEITHGDIGRYLLGRWNLPESLGETIMHHHEPSKGDKYKMLSAIVHLADYLTTHFQVGNLFYDNDMKLDKEIIEILDLGDEEYLEQFIESYKNLLIDQFNSISL